MTTEVDFYELLQCERTADAGTIKSAYRKLAIKYHPDKNAGCKDSEAKFKAINEAYDCLKDPQKRAAYDRYGHAAFRQGAGGAGGGAQDFNGFSDIFERGVPRQEHADHRRCLDQLRPLRRQRCVAGDQSADVSDLCRPWQGARATGLLRRRTRLSDLPRRRAGDRRSVPRL